MSRQKPWMKMSVGSVSPSGPKFRSIPSGRSTISTYRSRPSSVGMVRHSSYGSGPNRSSAKGSAVTAGRRRRSRSRSAATPTATPVAATPITAPTRPAPRAMRRGRLGSLTGVHPGDADGTHPGDDFVVDGADRLGPVVGGRFATLARAEEHRDVTGGHRVVAAVQHDLVHADPTGDGTPLSGQPYRSEVGGVPGYPVAVPEWHHGQGGVPRRRPAGGRALGRGPGRARPGGGVGRRRGGGGGGFPGGRGGPGRPGAPPRPVRPAARCWPWTGRGPPRPPGAAAAPVRAARPV